MRLMKPEDKRSSPCSKADLIKGISECSRFRAIDFPVLAGCTRSHLVDIAAELEILMALEEQVSIMKTLDSAGIKFDLTEDTYILVQRAVDHALAIYGVSDIESLGKNRKTSSFSKGIDPKFLEEVKARYREKCKMD